MPSISSVSGTLTHGSSITISGSDFGTKTQAGPLLYDHFDNAASGTMSGRTPIARAGELASYTWGVQKVGPDTTNADIVRSAASPKARSTYHARASFANSSDFWACYFPIFGYSGFTAGNELYISFYYRYINGQAGWPRQCKAWIAYPAVGSDRAYWSNAFGSSCQAQDEWFTHRSEDADLNSLSPLLGAQEMNNEWHRAESYLKQSTPSTADGSWHQTVYRPNRGTPQKHVLTLDNYKTRNTSDEWTDWAFGAAYHSECVADGGYAMDYDIDEFVLDTQRARVEIANTSTWAARAFSEYQVATAWATGEITVTLNAGHFGNTDTVYLYVIKSDGTVNANGFEITLGGGGGSAIGQKGGIRPMRGFGLLR